MVSVKEWITHWNTMESSELDPWLLGSFVCDKRCTSSQGRKSCSYWENAGSLYREKWCYLVQDGGLKNQCEQTNYSIDKKYMNGKSLRPRGKKGFIRQNFKAQSVKKIKGEIYCVTIKNICSKWYVTQWKKICAKSKRTTNPLSIYFSC